MTLNQKNICLVQRNYKEIKNMDEYEIQERIQNKMERDVKFKNELEDLLAKGLLELAEKLIRKAVGVVVDLASSFWEWLMNLFN